MSKLTRDEILNRSYKLREDTLQLYEDVTDAKLRRDWRYELFCQGLDSADDLIEKAESYIGENEK